MGEVEISEERDHFVSRVSREMRAGSESAFGLFYETYFDRLYRMALTQTRGDEGLARDLVQNILLRLVRHSPEFETEAKLWAWLKQVARSCHVDWIRRNRSSVMTGEVEEEAGDAPDDDVALQEALERGLEMLSVEERDLIERSYVQAEPHRKIAQDLRTTPKAVESKLARVRHKLRAHILKLLNDYAIF